LAAREPSERRAQHRRACAPAHCPVPLAAAGRRGRQDRPRERDASLQAAGAM